MELFQPSPYTFVGLYDVPHTYVGSAGFSVKVNGGGTGLTFGAAPVSTSFYTDTVSGTIDGANKTFTVANTISTALVLQLANSAYQPTVDFTTSGTTITMIVAPDASLSGQPFWLVHT